jgi:hypothetical protein
VARLSCKAVVADRIDKFIRETVPMRARDRCYADALMYARYAKSKLKEGDMDSAIGSLIAAERDGMRCKLWPHLK